jgi:tRNA 2-thiouridine synthesizing protein A
LVRLYKKGEGTYVLDVTGYTCPYPVIFTKKALAKLKEGEVLEVVTDNPPSCETVPNAAREEGHTVVGIEPVGSGVWKIVIRKGR